MTDTGEVHVLRGTQMARVACVSRAFQPHHVILLILALFAGATRAQDAVRLSLASAESAAARRRAATTMGYYNLSLGPTAWRFGTSLGIEYNDNVFYTQDAKSDLILRPELRTRMLWAVTDQNSLNLNLGAGYSAYLLNSGLSRYFISPGSELSFDIYAGDVWINLHDRFSITQNAYQDPTVYGYGNYSQLENDLGLSATWDLNKVIVQAGFDHVNYVEMSGGANRPSGESEIISASAGYALRPGTLAGIQLGGGLNRYSKTSDLRYSSISDATQWNAGLFCESDISTYVHVNVSGGYMVYTPDNPLPGGGTDFTGIYAQLKLRHRLNQYVDYSITASRDISFSFYGGTVDMYSARLDANWKLFDKTSLGTSFSYEHGSYLQFASEVFDRFGPSIRLNRALTQKLTSSLSYQFYWRLSDADQRNYKMNILSLSLGYTF